MAAQAPAATTCLPAGEEGPAALYAECISLFAYQKAHGDVRRRHRCGAATASSASPSFPAGTNVQRSVKKRRAPPLSKNE